MAEELILSTLPKTWIFDLDGTMVKHNGYKIDKKDTLLPGVKEFLGTIPEDDYILILTSRTSKYRELTLDFLKKNKVRYNEIIFDIPLGERIVLNDRKPSGINMSVAINLKRDEPLFHSIKREL